MRDFESTWRVIRSCEGEEFTTVRGPFTYKISGLSATESHERRVAKAQFGKLLDLMPVNGPGEINHIVMGPAYIFAILTDQRIN